MSTSAMSAAEKQITDSWNRAVDLGKKGQFRAMLESWLKVARMEEQHQVLADAEKARMHLFLGNAYLVNRKHVEACQEYEEAARLYSRLYACALEVQESDVQWIEEILEKWEQARRPPPATQHDDTSYTTFRARVPSVYARDHLNKDFDKVFVQARPGQWFVTVEKGPARDTFIADTFSRALQKAQSGARSDFFSSEWGPATVG